MIEMQKRHRSRLRRRTGVTNPASRWRERVHVVGLVIAGILALVGIYSALALT